MATEQFFNGTTDAATEYTINAFDFLNTADVKVSVNGGSNLGSSAYNVTADGVLTLTSAPGAGTGNVRAFRTTDVVSPAVTFAAGGSIRAVDLNRAAKQVRFAVEELQTVGADGAGIALTAGDKGEITVTTGTTWSIDNEAVTTAKLQDSTSTTTGVTTAKIADEAVTTAKIAADAVTMDKLGAGALPSDVSLGATQLTGTIPDARFPSVLPAIDGSSLTGIISTVANGCVYENNQTITSNYTVGDNKNAMSAGPITIGNGVVVTIGAGENFTII